MNEPIRSSTGRVTELDGIRGLAIALVLVWHFLKETCGMGIGNVTIAPVSGAVWPYGLIDVA